MKLTDKFKNLNLLQKGAVVILIGTILGLGYGFTNTYRSYYGEQNISASQMCDGALTHMRSHVKNDYHQGQKNSYVEHHAHKYEAKKNSKSPKRIAMVMKYMNANYDNHGIKQIKYNQKTNHVKIMATSRNGYVMHVYHLVQTEIRK